MAKRVYMREFPRSESERAVIAADWAPPDLKRAVLKKAKAEKVSVRTVILRYLAKYADWKPEGGPRRRARRRPGMPATAAHP